MNTNPHGVSKILQTVKNNSKTESRLKIVYSHIN